MIHILPHKRSGSDTFAKQYALPSFQWPAHALTLALCSDLNQSRASSRVPVMALILEALARPVARILRTWARARRGGRGSFVCRPPLTDYPIAARKILYKGGPS